MTEKRCRRLIERAMRPLLRNKDIYMALLLPALLLTACNPCNPWKHGRMVQQLQQLQQYNQADSLLTDLPLAQTLADWFDDHGTANEQLLAYYLLGRTHADRGEAPAAIAAYLDATERADTAANDCDYAQLSRVYAQMSDIFYRQNLMKDYLNSLDKSIRYATMAADSMMAFHCYAHKMVAYERMNQHDSVVEICNNLYNNYYTKGFSRLASQYFGAAISSYLKRQELEKAKELIIAYEQKSGFFDSSHNIEKGREAFYQYRGRYHLAIQEYDSAEFFFRKELTEGRDFINQNMAAHGLALLFKERHLPDSAIKYALYSYDMNDSAYSQMATREVEQTKGMYNYTIHQQKAQRAKELAEKSERKFRFLLTVIAFVITATFYAFYRIRQTKKVQEQEFKENLRKLKQAQEELQKLNLQAKEFSRIIGEKDSTIGLQKDRMAELKTREAELNELIGQKERAMESLQDKIKSYQSRTPELNLDLEIAKMLLEDSCDYQNLHKKTAKGITLTVEEWDALDKLTADVLCQFHEYITAREFALTNKEYRLCILLRLDVKPKASSYLMEVSPAAITKMSKSIMKKIFKLDGTAKDLAEKLQQLC